MELLICFCWSVHAIVDVACYAPLHCIAKKYKSCQSVIAIQSFDGAPVTKALTLNLITLKQAVYCDSQIGPRRELILILNLLFFHSTERFGLRSCSNQSPLALCTTAHVNAATAVNEAAALQSARNDLFR